MEIRLIFASLVKWNIIYYGLVLRICYISANWLEKFQEFAGRKLVGVISEIWTYIPHAQGVSINR